ncbi:MAG: acyl-CoA dehydrogenase family protein [Rhizomicrobium sp.]
MTAPAVEAPADTTEISRIFADGRIQKIYGGTNEIMTLLIAWSV